MAIYKDRVESDTFNYGLVNPDNLTPHAKNPAIANVFVQMGLVEELGSGVRKIFKYTPLYSGGKQPVIEEDDIFKIVIPYIEIETGQETGQETSLISPQIRNLLQVLGENEMSITEMMISLGLNGRDNFRKNYLLPAMSAHLVEMIHPENPKHRNQKYRISK